MSVRQNLADEIGHRDACTQTTPLPQETEQQRPAQYADGPNDVLPCYKPITVEAFGDLNEDSIPDEFVFVPNGHGGAAIFMK